MKRYIAVLELEADEESIEADVKYNYSSNGKDYSIIEKVWFEEESKEKSMKTYEDGLNEAWETARKVLCDSGSNLVKLEDIFDSHTLDGIFSIYTGKEAIEKIKEYEEKQEKSVYKVGDRVEIIEEHDIVGLPAAKVGTIGEVMEIDCVSDYLVKTYGENSIFYYYSGNALKSANDVIIVGDEVVDKNVWGIKGVVTETTERLISIVEERGNVSRWEKENFEKTGRHFSEIEKVLKQMKEI